MDKEKHPSYGSWWQMMYRCYYPKHKHYDNYGGRGITVCRRWHDFDNFVADMGCKPRGWTIERKDNDKGYMPSNCRWATHAEQARNTRCNLRIDNDIAVDHSIRLGGNISLVNDRIRKLGWDPQRAITEPLHPKPRRKE